MASASTNIDLIKKGSQAGFSLSKSDILKTQEQLNDRIVKTAKQIADSFEKNQAALLEGKVPNVGVQYPLPYMKALKKANQAARFDWLREKGAALRGFLKGFGYIESSRPGYMILPSKKPSQAIDEALSNLLLIDCGNACQLCQWQGVRVALGDEKFDVLFKADSGFPLMIASRDDNPLNRLRVFTETPSNKDVQKADMVYIQSTSDYADYHPFGGATGYNAVCVDAQNPADPKVTIHGLPAEGAALKEVGSILYRDLQKEPILIELDELPEAAQRSFHKLPKPQPKPEISFEAFLQKGGGALTQRMWIDPEKVTLLKLLPSEEGKEALASWSAKRLDLPLNKEKE